MKKHTLKTRHALLLSLLSLTTCFAMLLGSTFAWFTDSVTSGVNRIVSGNLDVELLHTNAKGENETVVNTMEKLFKKDINGHDLLWEPEVISFEKFTVNNLGTLALKYQMTLNNVGYNTLEGNSLLDVIKVAIAADAPADRAAAQALFADGQTYYSLNELVNSPITLSSANDGKLAAANANSTDDTEEFALVLYWPQSASDNNWNVQNGKVTSDGNPLYIDLGITLVATQDTVEADSFDKYYDDNATQPADSYATQRVSYSQTLTAASNPQTVVAEQPTTLSAAATPASSSGNTTVTFETGALTANQDAVLTVKTKNVLAANTENGTFTFESGESQTENSAVASIDLTLKVGDNTVETFSGKNATVNTYITKGLTSVLVKYKTDSSNDAAFKSGVPAAEVNTDTPATVLGTANYNPSTGYLSFVTNHFSEYVVYDNVVAYNATSDKVYANLQTAINEAKSGAEIVLLKDVTTTDPLTMGGKATYTATITKSLTLDGNGHRITATTDRVVGIKGESADKSIDVTLKNVTLKASSNSNAMCIFTSNYVNSLSLDGVIADDTAATTGYVQAMTIAGSDTTSVRSISIKNSKILNQPDKYYAIIMYAPVNLAVENSEIQGWANLYFKNGSDGSTVNINGGSLTSVGVSASTNDFGLISFESGENKVNITNTDISVSTTATDSYQSLVMFSEWHGPNTGNTVSITGGSVTLSGEHAVPYLENGTENKLTISNSQINMNGEVKTNYSYTSPEPEGREVDLFTSQSNGVQILPVYVGYYTLSDLLSNACPDGFWIEFKQDVTLEGEHQITAANGATFGIVFGDYSLTLAEGAKLVLPTNATIKTDKRVADLFSAPDDYTVTETVLEGGGYTYTVTESSST